VLATANATSSEVSIIDTRAWRIIKRIETRGPASFIRSHDEMPYAWSAVLSGSNRGLMQIIDKQTLSLVKTLQPAPGKILADVGFTRDGKYALVSIADRNGALVIYDARNLDEVKRLPIKSPSGIYNAYNKRTQASWTNY
jgi:hypothetical protein